MEKHFGQWLKHRIEDAVAEMAGGSIKGFAAMAHVHRVTLQDWFNEERPTMRGTTASRVAKALGMDPDAFRAVMDSYR